MDEFSDLAWPKRTYECKTCYTPFTPKRSDQVFCCRSCNDTYQNRRKAKIREELHPAFNILATNYRILRDVLAEADGEETTVPITFLERRGFQTGYWTNYGENKETSLDYPIICGIGFYETQGVYVIFYHEKPNAKAA